MDVVGRLDAVMPAEQVTERFRKREFVVMVEPDGKYPQPILFQLANDKVSLIDDLEPGDMVHVHFNLRGREWNGPKGTRFFNTLDAWKVTLQGRAERAPDSDDFDSEAPF